MASMDQYPDPSSPWTPSEPGSEPGSWTPASERPEGGGEAPEAERSAAPSEVIEPGDAPEGLPFVGPGEPREEASADRGDVAAASGTGGTPGHELAPWDVPLSGAAFDSATLVAASGSSRLPSRFTSDLMRAIFDATRDACRLVVEQTRRDAETIVESLRVRSAGDGTALQQRADEDVEAIHEWSRQAMARISRDTEDRIALRHLDLTRELDANTGQLDDAIGATNARVAEFEETMKAFVERLAGSRDPATLVDLAQRIPEPPSLALPTAAESAGQERTAWASVVGAYLGPQARPEDLASVAGSGPADAGAEEGAATEAVAAPAEAVPAAETAPTAPAETWPASPAAPATAAWPESGAGAAWPPVPADSAAQEAPAAPAGWPYEPEERAPTATEGAWLLGGEPAAAQAAPAAPAAPVVTHVSVTGLESVGGVTALRRRMAALTGVENVSVSARPDGGFLFDVSHEPGLQLGEVVPALPGFAARVVGSGGDVLIMSAQDPDRD